LPCHVSREGKQGAYCTTWVKGIVGYYSVWYKYYTTDEKFMATMSEILYERLGTVRHMLYGKVQREKDLARIFGSVSAQS